MTTSLVRNNPSHVLTKIDNMFVTAVLGPDRISMCTAYAQICVASEEQDWLIVGTGPLCLAHDFQQNTFILILINSNCDRVVWESELTHCTEYLCVSDKFHLLRLDQLIGVNFICSFEAQYFQLKLVEVSKYIKVTCLECVTGHNNLIAKNKKKIKSKTSQNKNPEKKTKKQESTIKFGISYITKYYRKVKHRGVSYQKLESPYQSLPSSPIKDVCWRSSLLTRSNSSNSHKEDKTNLMYSINPCHE